MSEHLDHYRKGSGRQVNLPSHLVAMIVSPIAARRRAWGEALLGHFATVEVARKRELRAMLPRVRPTVLLLDGSGRGVIEPSQIVDVQRQSPQTGILTALERSDLRIELSLILSGVRGCFLTRINAPLLRKAVESVIRGEYRIRRRVLEAILESRVAASGLRETEHLARDFARMLHLLTSRQREIVRLVGVGGSNKEIAHRLNLSEKTVKAHLTSAFQKLGISDRLRLALLVTRPSSSYVPQSFTEAARDSKRLSYWLKR